MTGSRVLLGLLWAGWTFGCGSEPSSPSSGTESSSETGASSVTSTTGGTSSDATTSSTGEDEVTTDSSGDSGNSEGSTTSADSTTDATGTAGSSTSSTNACEDDELNGDETDVDCGGSCSACPTGSGCGQAQDCDSALCETGSCLGPLPGCSQDEVQGDPGGEGWKDSYSVDGNCYCDSTFDHDVGAIVVETPYGSKTVLEICEAIGPGPGAAGNPIYNDIQCGNGPANDAGDEDWCPGRVDQGQAGCCVVGPLWDLTVFE